MPNMFGKDNKKKELIANLGEIYIKIEKEHQISPGDFPKLAKMQVTAGQSKPFFLTPISIGKQVTVYILKKILPLV